MGHHVDVPGIEPVCLACLRAAAPRDPGIGAIQVDLAKLGPRPTDQSRDAILRSRVSWYRDRPAVAGPAARLGPGGDRPALPAVEHHPSALAPPPPPPPP